MTLSVAVLDTWVGRNVRDFCIEGGPALRRADSTYHCAHFVAHVLGLLRQGSTLVPMGVPEIARRCAHFRQISIGTASGGWQYPQASGVIYVTPAGHLHTTGNGLSCRCTGIDGTQRHVGFYINGQVWHYENDSQYERVVSYMLGIGSGSSRFYNRYGPNCELWLSDLPPGCVARSFSERLETQEDLRLLR